MLEVESQKASWHIPVQEIEVTRSRRRDGFQRDLGGKKEENLLFDAWLRRGQRRVKDLG